EPAPQEVYLPDSCIYKLEKYLGWKAGRGESLASDAPLFVSRNHRRLSTRRVREAFAEWQVRAGFEQHYAFHNLPHAALTRVYRKTKDIKVTQRVGRHKSVDTTSIYASVTDDDIIRAVRDLRC